MLPPELLYQLQSQAAEERLQDGTFELERAIQSELDRQRKLQEAKAKEGIQVREQDAPPTPPLKKVTPPKPVVDVAATREFNKLGNGLYLESQSYNYMERFAAVLKAELEAAIQ